MLQECLNNILSNVRGSSCKFYKTLFTTDLSLGNKFDKQENKKPTQIKDEDVKKLGKGYLHDIPLQEQELYQNPTEDNYYALNDSLQGYLLALNRKRYFYLLEKPNLDVII